MVVDPGGASFCSHHNHYQSRNRGRGQRETEKKRDRENEKAGFSSIVLSSQFNAIILFYLIFYS